VRTLCQLLQPAAIGTDRPDMKIAVAIGLEYQALAVWCPIRLRDFVEVARESMRRASADSDEPQPAEQIERDRLAIGRYGRGDGW